MNVRLKSWLPLFTAVLLVFQAGMISAANAKNSGDDVVKDFVAHVEALTSIGDDVKKEIRDLVAELRADEYSQMEAITGGLSKIYSDYEAALAATQSDDLDNAIGKLTPFVDSDDKFLAADATFFLARTLMNSQRYEEALPLLETLASDLGGYSLHAGPAVYFSGVAQANLLENQRAIKSFASFLEQHEDAPERLRVAAWRQIQMIQAIQEGAMDDVLQRMDYSKRRLEIKKTNESTQIQQEKIVGMLARLIKEQEKKECSSCSSKKNCEGEKESEAKGKKEGEGEGKSNAGGSSNNPNGVVRRTYDDGPASPWSQLRNRTRDAANNAVKEKLPARYKPVVEGYYDKTSGNDGK